MTASVTALIEVFPHAASDLHPRRPPVVRRPPRRAARPDAPSRRASAPSSCCSPPPPCCPTPATPDGALRARRRASTALRTSGTAGPGVVTPAMQAEIDRVVARGPSARVRPPAPRPRTLAAAAARCADLRRPALLPRHRLDHRHRARGRGPARRRARDRRPPAASAPATSTRPPPCASRPGMTPAARAAAERPSSTAAASRSPRSGCCATRSRACRCPPTSPSATPRRWSPPRRRDTHDDRHDHRRPPTDRSTGDHGSPSPRDPDPQDRGGLPGDLPDPQAEAGPPAAALPTGAARPRCR